MEWYKKGESGTSWKLFSWSYHSFSDLCLYGLFSLFMRSM